jgi:uncharacterized membrane protein
LALRDEKKEKMSENNLAKSEISILSIVFYGLAGIVAVMVLVVLWGVVSIPMTLDNINGTISLMGLGSIAGLVVGPLKGILINAGIVVMIVLSGLAGTLFGVGRLAARQTRLLARVAQLEEEIRALKK